MSTSQTEFMTKEAVLAKQLGVNRQALKVARESLVEGEDWAMDGREVAYSAKGVIRLRTLITASGEDPAEKTAPAGDGEADAPTPPVDVAAEKNPAAVVAVVSSLTKNRQILMATLGDRQVRVRVRDNAKFVAGMEIEIQHLDEIEGDLYDLIGRAPRAKGVW